MARSSVLLPLPLGPEQDEEFALADLDGNVVDDGKALIPLGDLVEGDGHGAAMLPRRDRPRQPKVRHKRLQIGYRHESSGRNPQITMRTSSQAASSVASAVTCSRLWATIM